MSAHKKTLLAKIRRREAVIAVYGLGYVGLPLALRLPNPGLPPLALMSIVAK